MKKIVQVAVIFVVISLLVIQSEAAGGKQTATKDFWPAGMSLCEKETGQKAIRFKEVCYTMPIKRGRIVRITRGPGWFKRKYHNGTDLATVKGEPVLAVAPGKVIKIKNDRRGYGWYVIIRHQNKTETLYAHLKRRSIKIKTGQLIRRGDLIGKVGINGNSSGPHLHFEVRGAKLSLLISNLYPKKPKKIFGIKKVKR